MSADEFIVTPWHVEGDIDYDKLIEKFGTEKISPELREKIKNLTKEDHFMLRRGIFFSHREMNRILDDYEKGIEFFLYTGRGPSGHTHIGHLVPWMFAKWLQEKFDVNLYFQLTDDEKFYSKANLTLEETNKYAYENALDFIALGFNPEKTKTIINTKNIQTLYPIAAQVAKKINFSNTKATFGFTNETNIGMIFYTSLQSAPCFIEDKPVLIPLGVDQDPHFRLTRDIAQKIGKQKPALIHNIMVPALTGPGGKMSASDEKGTIYTTDTPEMVKKKSTSSLISELKRKTRKVYSSEEKIRIIIDGIRGETTIAELCRKEGISQGNYYKWTKDFMEAGKRRLSGDTMREANTTEVQELKGENSSLKELVAELSLEVRTLKKNTNGGTL